MKVKRYIREFANDLIKNYGLDDNEKKGIENYMILLSSGLTTELDTMKYLITWMEIARAREMV